jgi:hypothetical protein
MSGFAVIRKGMLDAFADRWDVIRPEWDAALQTTFPPSPHTPQTDLWLKVDCTVQGGQNRAVSILDEVFALMTVDCFARLDTSDATTMFAEDLLADDVHNALRSMVLPSGVDGVNIVPRDFPVTRSGYQQKRVSLFFKFDLPRNFA